MQEIIIGTRASKLALAQSKLVVDQLLDEYPDFKFALKKISTRGDRILDRPLSAITGQGLFIKEIEVALLNQEIDLAVHSYKDLPAELAPGLEIGAIPERASALDVLVSKDNKTLEELPTGAKIGTGSLRRKAQLLYYRPDLEIINLRGNIDSRIKRLEESSLDAIVLAAAGLERLGWGNKISQYLGPTHFLPAARQGALALEIRAGDQYISNLINPLHHKYTAYCVTAEQAFLSFFGGGCKLPIGAYAFLEGEKLFLEGMVARIDGSQLLRGKLASIPEEAEGLGRRLAEKIYHQGAGDILNELRGAERDGE
jgi:hydroxymethylbilane synthase